MFIVLLTYTVPLADIDAQLDAHLLWLKQGYAKGLFLASGRKVPRTGGVILARGERVQLEAYLAEDPFATTGVAHYDVIEYVATMTVAGLESLRDG